MQLLEEISIEFEAKVMFGISKNIICEEAKAREIRFIIMGSRGHSFFVGGVLGSVSQGVTHLADCPVMVIPANSECDQ